MCVPYIELWPAPPLYNTTVLHSASHCIFHKLDHVLFNDIFEGMWLKIMSCPQSFTDLDCIILPWVVLTCVGDNASLSQPSKGQNPSTSPPAGPGDLRSDAQEPKAEWSFKWVWLMLRGRLINSFNFALFCYLLNGSPFSADRFFLCCFWAAEVMWALVKLKTWSLYSQCVKHIVG